MEISKVCKFRFKNLEDVGVILDVESSGDANLEQVGQEDEGDAAEEDSEKAGEFLKEGVERQGNEEQSDQRGEEPGSEEHLIPEH